MTEHKFPTLVSTILEGMENLKAENITVLDLTSLDNSICSFFVLANGNSNTQVKAIADSVEELVRKNLKDKPWHVEGRTTAEWVLMDYVNVVVHVFQKTTREFYDLEGLWGDAKTTNL
jgi:ribosome-associated protein